MAEPKILLFDIETAPNISYLWGLYNEVTSMEFVVSNWYILCWSAKWLGKKEIISSALYNSSENDKKIVKKLWNILNEADIVIAHNAIGFDCKKANTRFITHKLSPPSPYKIIDTLKIARKYFYFTSNRLNDLGVFLGVGKKNKTGGFELWKRCMSGDRVAWNKMVKYCNQDVRLLERIYLKLRPYIIKHPNMSLYTNRPVCPKCGNKTIQYRGYAYTRASKFRRFQCTSCGAWGRNKKGEKDTDNTTRNT